MDALNRVIAMLAGAFCLSGCVVSTVKVIKNVVPDSANCRPTSSISSELTKSQLGCHQGVAGDGVQVLVSDTTYTLSVSSDTMQQEVISIFLYPANGVEVPGSVKIDAFYSTGLAGLTGKAGCVGILEDGVAQVEFKSGKPFLNYRLNFVLVSPLGWKQNCQEPYHTSGTVELK